MFTEMSFTAKVMVVLLLIVEPECNGHASSAPAGSSSSSSATKEKLRSRQGKDEGMHSVVKGASNASKGQAVTGHIPTEEEEVEPAPEAAKVVFLTKSIAFGKTKTFTATRTTINLSTIAPKESLEVKGIASAASPTKNFFAELSGESLIISFIPETAGVLTSNITVFTNIGDLIFVVEGTAVESRYKITPLTNIVVPAGAVYKRDLTLYNPFPRKIVQVVNCTTENLFIVIGYSPGQHRWNVNPLQKESLVTLSLLPLFPGALEGTIKIVLSLRGVKDDAETIEVLEIPVSCLSVKAGVFANVQEVDLGKVSSVDVLEQAVTLMSTVSRKGKAIDARPVVLSHVEVERDGGSDDVFPDPEITFIDTVVPSGGSTEAFRVTLHPPDLDSATIKQKINKQGVITTHGTLVVHYGGSGLQESLSSPLRLPYKATYIPGYLGYNVESTLFYSGKPEAGGNAPKELTLKNHFNVPLEVTGLLLGSPYFSLVPNSLAKLPFALKAGGSLKIFSIKFEATKPLFVCGNITLFSNLTDLIIPLQAYHGRLGVTANRELASETGKIALTAFEPTALNLGLLSVPQQRSIQLYLVNPNPVPVTIKSLVDGMASPLSSIPVTAVKIAKKKSFNSLTLAPKEVVPLSAKLPIVDEGEGRSAFTINFGEKDRTPQGIDINIAWQALKGQASFVVHNTEKIVSEHSPLQLGNVLMASRSEAPVFINSTYGVPLTITNITSNDRRVQLWISCSTIVPNSVTEVGRVVVVADAREGRIRDGRVGGAFRRKTLCADDIDLYKAVQSANSAAGTELLAVVSVVLSTSEVTDSGNEEGYTHSIPLHVTSVPQKAEILDSNEMEFGMVEVGKHAEKRITVYNRGHSDLHVHLLRWAEVPAPLTLLLQQTLSLGEESLGDGDFHLSHSSVRRAILLPGESAVLGPIFYEPSSSAPSSSVFIVRNSISGVEGVTFTGEGGRGVLSLKKGADDADSTTLHLGVAKTSLLKLAKLKSRLGRPFSARGEFVPWTCLAALVVYGVGWMNTSYIVVDHFHGVHHLPQPISQAYSDPVRFSKTFRFVNTGNHHVAYKNAWLRDRVGALSCEVGGLLLEGCVADGPAHKIVEPGEELAVTLTFVPDFTTDCVTATLWLETEEGDGVTYEVRGVVPRDQVLLHHDNLTHTLRETLLRALCLLCLLAVGLSLSYSAASDVLEEVFPNFFEAMGMVTDEATVKPVPLTVETEKVQENFVTELSAELIEQRARTPAHSSQTQTPRGGSEQEAPSAVPLKDEKFTPFPGFVIAAGTPTSSQEPSPVNSGSFSSKGDRSTTPSSAPSSAVGDRIGKEAEKKQKKKKKERDRAGEEEARRRLEAKVRKEQEDRRLASEAASKLAKEKAKKEEEDSRRRELARLRADEERKRQGAEEALRIKTRRIIAAEQKEREIVETAEADAYEKFNADEEAGHARLTCRAKEETDRAERAQREMARLRIERERKESERQKQRDIDQQRRVAEREREDRERRERERERRERERIEKERLQREQQRDISRRGETEKKWFDHRGKPPTTKQFYQQGPHMRGKGNAGYTQQTVAQVTTDTFNGNGHKHAHYQQESMMYWEPAHPQPPTTMHPTMGTVVAQRNARDGHSQQDLLPQQQSGAVEPPAPPPPLLSCGTFSLFDQPAVAAVTQPTTTAANNQSLFSGNASGSTSSTGNLSPSNPWLPIGSSWGGDEWHPMGRQSNPDAGTIGSTKLADDDAGSSLFTADFLREHPSSKPKQKESHDKEKLMDQPLYDLFSNRPSGAPKPPQEDGELNLDDVLKDIQSEDTPQFFFS